LIDVSLVMNFCSSSSMCFNNLDFMTLICWRRRTPRSKR
jgi:hypothetical protein